jgi:hypothetical protein
VQNRLNLYKVLHLLIFISFMLRAIQLQNHYWRCHINPGGLLRIHFGFTLCILVVLQLCAMVVLPGHINIVLFNHVKKLHKRINLFNVLWRPVSMVSSLKVSDRSLLAVEEFSKVVYLFLFFLLRLVNWEVIVNWVQLTNGVARKAHRNELRVSITKQGRVIQWEMTILSMVVLVVRSILFGCSKSVRYPADK